MNPTRRDFLKMTAMISGAAGISGFVPSSIRRALAIEPAPGSTYRDAEHIVILMQENRSFDHALGTLQGVRGFNDPRAMRLGNGNSVFVQAGASGASFAPWRFDIRDTKITWMGSVPHSRNSQVDAWNGGQHNNWIDAKRSYSKQYADIPLTMGHYTREDLPFYYALADAFTVCDQSYCGVMSSTTPNRSTFWTGTIRDRQSTDSRVFMRNNEILSGGMTWKTYPERLTDAGIAWKFYQNELTNAGGLTHDEEVWLSNFGCNLLEYFAAYNIEAYPGAALAAKESLDRLSQEIAKMEDSLSEESDPDAVALLRDRIAADQKRVAGIKAHWAGISPDLYRQLTPQQRLLHDSAFITNAADPNYHALEPLLFEESGGQPQQINVPKGDILHQFRQDVDSGNLPTVSWISAPERFSDHPQSPWYGAWYVSQVVDILTKNPEVWKKTIFILTYDENDGYFDHSPAFVAADPRRPETGGASTGIDTGLEYTYAQDELNQGVPLKEARSGPIGLGFRVPTIVASPWSRGGWVNSQIFDHTSTLMFLEDFMQQKFGKTVREDNISAWRRAISGDLTSCFRPQGLPEPKLNYLERDKFVVSIAQARNKEVPSNYHPLSEAQIEAINTGLQRADATAHQEPGIRPACALPYELYAHGGLSADGSHFDLHLAAANTIHGGNAIGAPFNVYLRNLQAAPTSLQPATYAVRAGDALHPSFPLSLFAKGQYVIEVHGPNGFFRSFTGSADAAAPSIELAYERSGAKLTGNLQLHLHNPGAHPLTVSVRQNAYGTGSHTRTIAAGAKASVVVPAQQSHGWYDISVEDAATSARFTGRVETGQPSFTDPVMGGLA